MTCFREAINMIMTMIGTAATPLMTALQNKALYQVSENVTRMGIFKSVAT